MAISKAIADRGWRMLRMVAKANRYNAQRCLSPIAYRLSPSF